MKVCGENNCKQLGVNSNSTGDYKGLWVSPPLNSPIDVNSIISISVYSAHSILITNDGRAFGYGYNGDGRILGSLPHDTIGKTEIEIHDSEGNKCKFISAVCGDTYTLYLVSSEITQNNQLVYIHDYGKQLYLNIGDHNPIKLFGGNKTSAAISDNGSIFIINSEKMHNTSSNEIFAINLPDNEKAASLSCCEKFVSAVSENGKLFMAHINENNPIRFYLVP